MAFNIGSALRGMAHGAAHGVSHAVVGADTHAALFGRMEPGQSRAGTVAAHAAGLALGASGAAGYAAAAAGRHAAAKDADRADRKAARAAQRAAGGGGSGGGSGGSAAIVSAIRDLDNDLVTALAETNARITRSGTQLAEDLGDKIDSLGARVQSLSSALSKVPGDVRQIVGNTRTMVTLLSGLSDLLDEKGYQQPKREPAAEARSDYNYGRQKDEATGAGQGAGHGVAELVGELSIYEAAKKMGGKLLSGVVAAFASEPVSAALTAALTAASRASALAMPLLLSGDTPDNPAARVPPRDSTQPDAVVKKYNDKRFYQVPPGMGTDAWVKAEERLHRRGHARPRIKPTPDVQRRVEQVIPPGGGGMMDPTDEMFYPPLIEDRADRARPWSRPVARTTGLMGWWGRAQEGYRREMAAKASPFGGLDKTSPWAPHVRPHRPYSPLPPRHDAGRHGGAGAVEQSGGGHAGASGQSSAEWVAKLKEDPALAQFFKRPPPRLTSDSDPSMVPNWARAPAAPPRSVSGMLATPGWTTPPASPSDDPALSEAFKADNYAILHHPAARRNSAAPGAGPVSSGLMTPNDPSGFYVPGGGQAQKADRLEYKADSITFSAGSINFQGLLAGLAGAVGGLFGGGGASAAAGAAAAQGRPGAVGYGTPGGAPDTSVPGGGQQRPDGSDVVPESSGPHGRGASPAVGPQAQAPDGAGAQPQSGPAGPGQQPDANGPVSPATVGPEGTGRAKTAPPSLGSRIAAGVGGSIADVGSALAGAGAQFAAKLPSFNPSSLAKNMSIGDMFAHGTQLMAAGSGARGAAAGLGALGSSVGHTVGGAASWLGSKVPAAPVGAATASPAAAAAGRAAGPGTGPGVKLSDADVGMLAKAAWSEVDPRVRGKDSDQFDKQTHGVLDSMTNRLASGRYGSSVQQMLDQKSQFSAISGNPNAVGDVNRLPEPPKWFSDQVRSSLAARADGSRQDVTGGGTHYFNPTVSHPAWGPGVVAQGRGYGVGSMTQYYGTPTGQKSVGPYGITMPGGTAPGTPSQHEQDVALGKAPADNGIGASGASASATRNAQLAIAAGYKPNLTGVDPRLREIMGAAGTHLPPGYRAEVTEGYNPSGHVPGSQHHILGSGALDMRIVGPQGVIPNEGSDKSGMYTRLARAAYGEMLARHPELKGHLTWGGGFGASRTNSAADLMHFDLGRGYAGERGNPDRWLTRMGALPGETYGAAAKAAAARNLGAGGPVGDGSKRRGDSADSDAPEPPSKNEFLMRPGDPSRPGFSKYPDAVLGDPNTGLSKGAKQTPLLAASLAAQQSVSVAKATAAANPSLSAALSGSPAAGGGISPLQSPSPTTGAQLAQHSAALAAPPPQRPAPQAQHTASRPHAKDNPKPQPKKTAFDDGHHHGKWKDDFQTYYDQDAAQAGHFGRA